MRLECSRFFNRDDGVKVELDSVLYQMVEIPRLAIGKTDELVVPFQSLQPFHGVVEGFELLPHLHEFLDFVAGEGNVVGAERIEEGVLAGCQIAAVSQHQKGVLVLLDSLPQPPLRPKLRAVYWGFAL